jgi:hypothetical protein
MDSITDLKRFSAAGAVESIILSVFFCPGVMTPWLKNISEYAGTM